MSGLPAFRDTAERETPPAFRRHGVLVTAGALARVNPGALGREDLLSLLRELADDLEVRGASATLFVVGGAEMGIAFDGRWSTHDIDAAFEPSREVRAAAATVAARHSLDEDRLNDGAKGFMSGNDPGASLALDTPSLRVELASAE